MEKYINLYDENVYLQLIERRKLEKENRINKRNPPKLWSINAKICITQIFRQKTGFNSIYTINRVMSFLKRKIHKYPYVIDLSEYFSSDGDSTSESSDSDSDY